MQNNYIDPNNTVSGLLPMKWISVKDGLPEVYTPVLVTYLSYNDGTPKSDAVAVIDEFGTWGWWDGDDADETVAVPITHWMPLPEPPKEANNG